MSDGGRTRADTRAAIIAAAADLMREGGAGAVTTRGVADRAGVQAPTIFRLFGDKDGLLEAVAEHVMAAFVSEKAAAMAAAVDVDPLDDLRASWRRQIEFALANPAVFRLLSDPERSLRSPVARRGQQILEARVHRLAETGRLQVSEPHAVGLIQAAGTGTIQTLLATPPEQRDPDLAGTMMEAVLARILSDIPAEAPDGPLVPAVALRAHAAQLEALSAAERLMLTEWLDRVIAAPGAGSPSDERRRAGSPSGA